MNGYLYIYNLGKSKVPGNIPQESWSKYNEEKDEYIKVVEETL